ncbi:MAG: enoyl-CoA hydratase/isomerase family protein [Proteobacteria bacterium]|nr:enoyl-CoA hydratase/isomerase family protein [Pseudomonadota bacterium]MBU1389763.1 enoyl-CoA hydratase/isomerase family protein [Pseudomonadota bacterium]MBU1543772.1 enoyl-CoA hydratase/isomerase family protein [Pseudomonadota bacterium]MBU2429974.1 enoyl-CoA hydratase/isomerase family protein [Pseudomonadota bacterium]MBU2480127.1 enoyl-CoA hydratase/isomerase family protein [Pseudomonadota bacterium]
MSKATIEEQGDVAVVRMTNGTTNAINPEFIEDLTIALKTVRTDFRGMVLAGNAKFFVIGFDVPTLLKLDRAGMADFFHRFNQLILDLYTFALPTACAIAGHAIGGGNIIALATDYRFMVEGKKRIGLNEIQLGVPVPYLADLILRQIVGDRAATEMLYTGDMMSVAAALKFGLVDETVPEEDLELKAIEKIANFAKFSSEGFAAIKANRTGAIQVAYLADFEEKNAQFIDLWFSQNVQALLHKAAEKF